MGQNVIKMLILLKGFRDMERKKQKTFSVVQP